MAEYIEREAATSAIARISNDSDMPEEWHKGMSVAMSAVCRLPAADVVPVVRCGECEHYKKRYWANGRCYGTFCDIWNRDHGKTFFCADGKRKGGDGK